MTYRRMRASSVVLRQTLRLAMVFVVCGSLFAAPISDVPDRQFDVDLSLAARVNGQSLQQLPTTLPNDDESQQVAATSPFDASMLFSSDTAAPTSLYSGSVQNSYTNGIIAPNLPLPSQRMIGEAAKQQSVAVPGFSGGVGGETQSQHQSNFYQSRESFVAGLPIDASPGKIQAALDNVVLSGKRSEWSSVANAVAGGGKGDEEIRISPSFHSRAGGLTRNSDGGSPIAEPDEKSFEVPDAEGTNRVEREEDGSATMGGNEGKYSLPLQTGGSFGAGRQGTDTPIENSADGARGLLLSSGAKPIPGDVQLRVKSMRKHISRGAHNGAAAQQHFHSSSQARNGQHGYRGDVRNPANAPGHREKNKKNPTFHHHVGKSSVARHHGTASGGRKNVHHANLAPIQKRHASFEQNDDESNDDDATGDNTDETNNGDEDGNENDAAGEGDDSTTNDEEDDGKDEDEKGDEEDKKGDEDEGAADEEVFGDGGQDENNQEEEGVGGDVGASPELKTDKPPELANGFNPKNPKFFFPVPESNSYRVAQFWHIIKPIYPILAVGMAGHKDAPSSLWFPVVLNHLLPIFLKLLGAEFDPAVLPVPMEYLPKAKPPDEKKVEFPPSVRMSGTNVPPTEKYAPAPPPPPIPPPLPGGYESEGVSFRGHVILPMGLSNGVHRGIPKN